MGLIVAGAFMGLLLTWLPLQLYFDISGTLSRQKDLLGNNYFIINKPVSVFNTLGLPTPRFNANEINDMGKQPFISRAAFFTVNRFKATVSAGIPNTDIHLLTDIFFEAVPDGFIDELPPGFRWRKDDAEVPVIVPADYFNLYNFGFAAGQGLPPISHPAASLISFNINILSAHSTATFTGRITGFSGRINSILIPQSFMDYANKTFAAEEESRPSRLIAEVKDEAAFAKYIQQKGYETNNEELRSGKVKALSKTIMQVVLLLGLLIVLLSLGSFIQFSDLLVARAEYEIQTLNYLGYYYTTIAQVFFRYMALLILAATLLTLMVGLIARHFILLRFGNFFEEPVSFNAEALLILFAVEVLYLLINYLNLLRHCRKLSLPKD